ncbi:adenosylcobinamide-GDP ribazoletransferase [Cereibacter sphaeroides]|uniref:adenosylcobinamide-GDP ribazoletransferase n=1 Tax=Cereibacter sphaeroides TaxID=1063 RepID=UPI001F33E4DD|nr:adenosylcobinamide-GDP ribazoletransferase [Cereibacter sphaeroides]MCE6961491.1 adenosylcobinamide-GDP ribazoletransferase [Cereibacter sphaeroides]MCE6971478.1 adenosylcobinamide-GDP ribazoletransferase [Cereibacter sphaeroides]
MKDRLSHWLADVQLALALLTRLPLPARSLPDRGARAAWAWPLSGVAVGGLAAAVAVLALGVGLPATVAAALALGMQALATGAMHEDGLADTADGLWGGWTRERRLEIMKDSRSGSYGVAALVLVGLVRWSALAAVLEAGSWGAVVAAAVLSRVPMVVLMAWLPNARGAGLSQSLGRPDRRQALVAAGVGLGVALAFGGPEALVMAAAGAAAARILGLVAQAKIGGQTGDILGASQQLSEAAALVAAAA